MPKKQIRYAVVGLGHIAQVAVLPAFANARRNSRLAALVSGDALKREELSRKYGVEKAYSYAQYDEVDMERYEPRVVHVAKDTNTIIDVDAAVATLLT